MPGLPWLCGLDLEASAQAKFTQSSPLELLNTRPHPRPTPLNPIPRPLPQALQANVNECEAFGRLSASQQHQMTVRKRDAMLRNARVPRESELLTVPAGCSHTWQEEGLFDNSAISRREVEKNRSWATAGRVYPNTCFYLPVHILLNFISLFKCWMPEEKSCMINNVCIYIYKLHSSKNRQHTFSRSPFTSSS